MLETNLIPNELLYQLEFGDLPPRAVPLSKKDLELLYGGSGSEGTECKTDRDCGGRLRCKVGHNYFKSTVSWKAKSRRFKPIEIKSFEYKGAKVKRCAKKY